MRENGMARITFGDGTCNAVNEKRTFVFDARKAERAKYKSWVYLCHSERGVHRLLLGVAAALAFAPGLGLGLGCGALSGRSGGTGGCHRNVLQGRLSRDAQCVGILRREKNQNRSENTKFSRVNLRVEVLGCCVHVAKAEKGEQMQDVGRRSMSVLDT